LITLTVIFGVRGQGGLLVVVVVVVVVMETTANLYSNPALGTLSAVLISALLACAFEEASVRRHC